jgi:hypothetical protein
MSDGDRRHSAVLGVTGANLSTYSRSIDTALCMRAVDIDRDGLMWRRSTIGRRPRGPFLSACADGTACRWQPNRTFLVRVSVRPMVQSIEFDHLCSVRSTGPAPVDAHPMQLPSTTVDGHCSCRGVDPRSRSEGESTSARAQLIADLTSPHPSSAQLISSAQSTVADRSAIDVKVGALTDGHVTHRRHDE